MDFKTEMAERTAQIEQIIKKYLPKEEGYQKTIMEAMNYSVLAGGKRLRPMLMQETYRLFGGRSEVIEPFMAAIEMIHTYSLVHDDLPAMDNDEYRRGKKTTHAVYGEAMGILAGDALLNYAYETAARAFAMEPGNPGVCQAFQILTAKAGIYGMVGGQTVDVESEGKPGMTKEKLDFIYRLKTSALIEGQCSQERCWREPRRANRRLSSRQPVRSDLHFRSRTTFWMSRAPWRYWESPSAAMRRTTRSRT